MTMNIKTYLTLCLIAFLPPILAGCGQEEKKKVLVNSKGLPSELLLVVDKEVWECDVKDTVELITDASVPGLSQSESFFRVTRIYTPHYERSYSSMHSKLFVHVDKTVKKPFVGVNRDVTARPQLEVTVSAGCMDELRGFLSRNRERIQDLIAEHQIEMRVTQLRKKYSRKVADDLRSTLSMSIRTPENLIATKCSENFLWGGTNLNQKDLNIVVYTYPWNRDEDVMNIDHFVEKRDSVMQRNIPGEHEGQWMQTSREKGTPLSVSRIRTIGGWRIFETRGLWEMRNGALGGPYVSLTRIDTSASRVIVSEGFVFSPSTEKRELIRQVEASLRTLEINK